MFGAPASNGRFGSLEAVRWVCRDRYDQLARCLTDRMRPQNDRLSLKRRLLVLKRVSAQVSLVTLRSLSTDCKSPVAGAGAGPEIPYLVVITDT